jgi:hypothetical protein
MRHWDISPPRPTSVTLRTATRQRLRDALRQLAQVGMRDSEQRLMRDCLRFALKFWRGDGGIAACNRRYNGRTGPYEIVPFCSTEALRRVCWARCHHAGVSFSRLMDFAVSCYLQRVLEVWMSVDFYWRDKEDAENWRALYHRRKNREDFTISYESRTVKCGFGVFEYAEKTEIQPWPPD